MPILIMPVLVTIERQTGRKGRAFRRGASVGRSNQKRVLTTSKGINCRDVLHKYTLCSRLRCPIYNSAGWENNPNTSSQDSSSSEWNKMDRRPVFHIVYNRCPRNLSLRWCPSSSECGRPAPQHHCLWEQKGCSPSGRRQGGRYWSCVDPFSQSSSAFFLGLQRGDRLQDHG